MEESLLQAFSMVLQGSIVDTDHDGAVAASAHFEESRADSRTLGGSILRRRGDSRRVRKEGHLSARNTKDSSATLGNISRIPEFAPGFACMFGEERFGLDVHYVGAETIDGKAVNHVEVGKLSMIPQNHEDVLDAALALDIYIDQNTLFVRTHSMPPITTIIFPYSSLLRTRG